MPTQMKAANGIQQCYETFGTRGPWVTLVHGSGDNHDAWGLQVPALSRRYRVLTYDVRGHGETETPASEPVQQETFVADLLALLDGLKIRRTAIVGYSMGAGIATNFAATHSDRIWAAILSNGARVDAPPHPARDAAMETMRAERIASIRAGGMESVFDGWLTSVYTPEFAIARPDIVEWHRKVMTANDPEKYIRTMSSPPSTHRVDISRITMPTLIIAGAGDAYSGPEQGRELAAALPKEANARVNVFPTRHGSPFERHEEYNRTLLQFLDANRPERT